MSDIDQISRPPTRSQQLVDTGFRWLCLGFAWLSVLMVAFIVLEIATNAVPAMRQHGLGFLVGTTWDPNTGQFGILPEIWGTLYTSFLAVLIGTAFGVAAAIFLSEGFLAQAVFQILKTFRLQFNPMLAKLPDRVEVLLKNLIE